MIDIKGKWALVTGASRGVGQRVAVALAEKGAKLILHSRDIAGTKPVVKQISESGGTALAVAAELSDTVAVDRLIAQVRSLCGNDLSILYNNAAIGGPSREIYAHTYDDYASRLLVNAIVPIKLCDAFLPGMLERDFGRIVNVSSGVADQPNIMPYSVSKAALDRYVRDMIPTLAGTNVLMNLLDPGWLRTDMGGPNAPNDPDTVLPGALVPVLLEKDAGSGTFYRAQEYRG
jgi:3-oxoacyl-[acyl-carrier protein] reductase